MSGVAMQDDPMRDDGARESREAREALEPRDELASSAPSTVAWRAMFALASLALVVIGWIITAAQISVLRNNDGGTIDSFPDEFMTAGLGLLLLGMGLLMLTASFVAEVVLRAQEARG